MKIIFDANPLLGQKSGVGYLTLSLIEAIAKNHPNDVELVGHYFNFLGKKDIAGLPQSSNISYKKTTLVPTKIINILRRFGIELPFEFFCREKSDVMLFTNFVSYPTLRKTNQVLFIHDASYIDTPQYVATANARHLKRYVPKSIKRANQIITISEFSKKRIKELYSPIIPISVMEVPPLNSIAKDDRVFKKYAIPKQYLLFIGTIEPRKNILRLLNSYREIIRTREVALVLSGGKGWNDSEIIDEINSIKASGAQLITTGYITNEEKSALLASATVYVQPSLYEGFGMPILEAMQAGAPVACSDLEVFREVAEDSAEYFDQESPKSISESILKILDNKNHREQLMKKSVKRYNSYPTWVEVSEKLLNKIQL